MAGETPLSDLTFLGRDSALARYIGRPVNRFLAVEAAGGILLLVATVAALVWVNSPAQGSYFDFWGASVDIAVGGVEVFADPLGALVNDALMALFFFVVGLEIKRELVTGQLRNPRAAALPAIAAVGGMIVPALIYTGFNIGGDFADGWGIPVATDIAFAVGVVSLLGTRIPRALKLFLLTLAIVDDVLAILVIAVFYTDNLAFGWLATAAGLLVLVQIMKRLRIWAIPAYVLVGAFVWWATLKSGVEATIAGVSLGLMTPARPLQTEDEARRVAEWLRDKAEVFLVDVRWANFNIVESRSVAERLETALHPFTAYVIIPLFALANAGVVLSNDVLRGAVSSRVTLGVAFGLVIGKTIGVTAFTLLAERLRIATRPRSMTRIHLLGLAIVAGIGFTVSIFVTTLAFEGDREPIEAEVAAGEVFEVARDLPEGGEVAAGEEAELARAADEAKIGILAASTVAAVVGLGVLAQAAKRHGHADREDR
ncbi:MAG: Na+/H+ antiporter NhaA [Acidimicrobiales bacterium]